MVHIYRERVDELRLTRVIKPGKHKNVVVDLCLFADRMGAQIGAQAYNLDMISRGWVHAIYSIRELLPDTPQQRDQYCFPRGGRQ